MRPRAGWLAATFLALGLPAWLTSDASSSARPPPSAEPVSRSPHGEMAGDCTTCHTPEGWVPLRHPLPFDHQGTGFPLDAAHSQASCRDCHRTLVFSQVGTACADCHRDAHQGELGPRCESCHAPESWTNRQEFVRLHNRTRFPLQAAHARVDCEACHRGQQPQTFVGTPTECVACHRGDYDRASNPNHRTVGFPTSCQDCHGTGDWRPATFDHARFFPLSGDHGGIACATCHVNPGSFRVFQCLSCHDRARMDDKHEDLSGFRYDSPSCYSCHPRGVE